MSREFDSILKNENSKNDRLHDFKKIPNDHIQLNPFLRISSECKWFVHFFTFFKNQFFELPTALLYRYYKILILSDENALYATMHNVILCSVLFRDSPGCSRSRYSVNLKYFGERTF